MVIAALHDPERAATVLPNKSPEAIAATLRRCRMIYSQLDRWHHPARLTVLYFPSQHAPCVDAGRVFPQGLNSAAALAALVRGTICGDNYLDLDFENCHPTILQQLARKLGLPCPELDWFNERREACVLEVADAVQPGLAAHHQKRKVGKQFVLKMANSDHCRLPERSPGWLHRLDKELSTLRRRLCAEFPWAVAAARRKAEMQNKPPPLNIEGMAMNMVLCSYERRILWALVHFLHKRPQNGRCRRPRGHALP